MEKLNEIMMGLIKSEISGSVAEKIGDDILSDEFFTALYKLSKAHDMAHIVGSAMASVGQLPKNEIGKKFEKQTLVAVFRYERLNYEYGQICRVLEENGIAYVPLKGSVIRALYPKPWMRTSCDIDILVRKEDLKKAAGAISDSLGYKTDGEEQIHDVSLFSENGIHLELHFSLIENMENIDRLLARSWEFSPPVAEGSSKHLQTKEFFVFHHVAHMYYHFVNGGCGIKPFADLYLLLEKNGHDDGTVTDFCNECGIGKFYSAVKRLALVWFGGEKHDDLTALLEDYLLRGGVYGTKSNVIAINQVKRGGKLKYTLSRIWIKFDHLKSIYPSVEKRKWLTPFYQIRRWFSVIFRGRLSQSVNELKISGQMTEEESGNIESILKQLDL